MDVIGENGYSLPFMVHGDRRLGWFGVAGAKPPHSLVLLSSQWQHVLIWGLNEDCRPTPGFHINSKHICERDKSNVRLLACQHYLLLATLDIKYWGREQRLNTRKRFIYNGWGSKLVLVIGPPAVMGSLLVAFCSQESRRAPPSNITRISSDS